MNFSEIIKVRQSCRSYNPERDVEEEKLNAVLEAARLAPSACNGQPYHITICRGECAKQVAKATTSIGINGFTKDAPILLVISEESYVATAAFGVKMRKNDYRSMDIGILAAYITSAATEVGLSTCIIGWLEDEKIREICNLSNPVRLVITLGYAKDNDKLREKKRKSLHTLVSEK